MRKSLRALLFLQSVFCVFVAHSACDDPLAKLGAKLSPEEITEIFNKGLQTQEDVEQLIRAIAQVSPRSGALIKKAQAAGTVIALGKKSVAFRTYDEILDRANSFASRVELARGSFTSPFELVHEIRHAVPYPNARPKLNLEPKRRSVGEMEELVVKHGYEDEAHSVEAEVHLFEDMTKAGFYYNYPLIRPGVLESYGMGGLERLAQDIPQLVPKWETFYQALARDIVAREIAPESEGNPLISYPGLEVKKSKQGLQISLDPETLRRELQNPDSALSKKLSPLMAKAEEVLQLAGNSLGAFLKNLDEKGIATRTAGLDPKALPEAASANMREILLSAREPSASSAQTLAPGEGPHNIERARIVSRYLDILGQKLEVDEGPTADFDNFYSLLSVAERSYGKRSADYYQRLWKAIHSDLDAKQKQKLAEKFHSLAVSMFKADFKKEARQLVEEIFAQHLSLQVTDDFSVQLMNNLVRFEEWELVQRMLPAFAIHFNSAVNSFPRRELKQLEDYYGHYTSEGLADIQSFLAANTGRLVTTPEIIEFRRKLHREKKLILKKGNSHLLQDDAYSNEPDHLKSLLTISGRAGNLERWASEIGTKNPQLATSLLESSALLNSWRPVVLQREIQRKFEDWESRLDHALPSEKLSVYGIVKSIESSAKANGDYNFSSEIQNTALNTARALFELGSRESHEVALKILRGLPATAQKLGALRKAVEHLPAAMNEAEVRAFLTEHEAMSRDSLVALREVSYHQNLEYASNLLKTLESAKPFATRFPPSPTRTQLHFEQQFELFKALTARPEAGLRKLGRDLLAQIPDSDVAYYNPRSYVSHARFVHGQKPSSYSIYTPKFFSPREYKIRMLADAAGADPQHATDYLDQAYTLFSKSKIDVRFDDLHEAEDNAFSYLRLAEAMLVQGRRAQAAEVLSKLASVWTSLEKAALEKAKDFESWPDSKKNQDYSTKNRIEDAFEMANFWQQHVASKLRAEEALALSKAGLSQDARARVQDILESYRAEIAQRRTRFDTKSMLQAAVRLSHAAPFKDAAIEALNLSIEKLALQRGDKGLFNSGIAYFLDEIQKSQLSHAEQDFLLEKLIKSVVPEESNFDAKDMLDSSGPLLTVFDSLGKLKKYPRAELEALVLLRKVGDKLIFSRHGDRWTNMGVLEGLRTLFERVLETHPEIMQDANAPAVKALSPEVSHQRAFSLIFPDLIERSTNVAFVENGAINLLALQNGNFDRARAGRELGAELAAAFSAKDSLRLRKVLEAFEILIEHDINVTRKGMDTYELIPLTTLENLPSMQDLRRLLGAKFNDPDAAFSGPEIEVLRTFLGAPNANVAAGKMMLYRHLLADPAVTIEALHLGVEGIKVRGELSAYLWNYFDQDLKSRSPSEQRRFAQWIARAYEDHSKPYEDRLMGYLIRHPEKADELLDRLKASKSAQLTSVHISGTIRSHLELRDHNDLEAFNRKAKSLANQKTADGTPYFWMPDPAHPLEVLAAHEARFHWFFKLDSMLDAMEAVYINRTYDAFAWGDKYTLRPEDIEAGIQRLRPAFKMTRAEKEGILALYDIDRKNPEHRTAAHWPDGRGRLSYNEVTEVFPRLKFTASERSEIIEFLNGSQDVYTDTVLETFGALSSDPARVHQIKENIEFLRADLEKAKRETEAYEKLPKLIKEQPELVRFLMSKYFGQLPFGEREAIYDEFEQANKGKLSSEQALRRFFELTGTEKIGQFLAMRHDLIPESFRKELEVFLESGKGSAFEEVKSTIEAELKKPVGSIFKKIDPKPLNVGTIGEVYEAFLLDGTRVVIKVITPSRRQALNLMLTRMETVVDQLQLQKERFHLAFEPREVGSPGTELEFAL